MRLQAQLTYMHPPIWTWTRTRIAFASREFVANMSALPGSDVPALMIFLGMIGATCFAWPGCLDIGRCTRMSFGLSSTLLLGLRLPFRLRRDELLRLVGDVCTRIAQLRIRPAPPSEEDESWPSDLSVPIAIVLRSRNKHLTPRSRFARSELDLSRKTGRVFGSATILCLGLVAKH